MWYPADHVADDPSPSSNVTPELRSAVHAVLGWQHGWCADCEPVAQREGMTHHEEGCAYWEAVLKLTEMVGLPRYAGHETAEQLEGQPWYRRYKFNGKIEDPAWPTSFTPNASPEKRGT